MYVCVCINVCMYVFNLPIMQPTKPDCMLSKQSDDLYTTWAILEGWGPFKDGCTPLFYGYRTHKNLLSVSRGHRFWPWNRIDGSRGYLTENFVINVCQCGETEDSHHWPSCTRRKSSVHSIIEVLVEDLHDFSKDKDACHEAWCPDFTPRDPQCERRGPTSTSCPLVSTSRKHVSPTHPQAPQKR